jgi:nicotinamide riboside transporter PnuC
MIPLSLIQCVSFCGLANINLYVWRKHRQQAEEEQNVRKRERKRKRDVQSIGAVRDVDPGLRGV